MHQFPPQTQSPLFCPECGAIASKPRSHGSFTTLYGGKIPRFKCEFCRKTFSSATNSLCYRQKRRDCNESIYLYLTSNISQRRLAKNLKINIKTVARKFVFLGAWAEQVNAQMTATFSGISKFEFDELETSEHTKCKPISVHLAVQSPSRLILGFKISKMPAKGRLAAISRKKYGVRPDERKKARRELFHELKSLVAPKVHIKSDQNPHYIKDVIQFFPDCLHQTFKGQKAAEIGQGELKKTKFDPLFSINHTLAKLRADSNRLIRKTWCTTKKEMCLKLHIHLVMLRHNTEIIEKRKKSKLAA